MHRIFKIFLQNFGPTFFILLFAAGSLFSQSHQVKTYSLQDDNKRIQVNVIFKNQVGYIYAGTNNGLYRFDGIRFYPINFANKNYNDSVTAIFQDRSGKYWVGFNSGKIANLLQGKLTYLDPEEGYPSEKITSFIQDKKGKIWFSTNGEGIYYFKDKRLYLLDKDDGLPDNNISSLTLADNGDILAGSDHGIICVKPDSQISISNVGPTQGLPDYIVTSICRAGKDSFWVGMQDKGFCLYNHATKKVLLPDIQPWTNGQVNALYASENNLYIATQNEGVFKYETATSDKKIITRLTTPQAINDLLQDGQGNVWASSPDAGLLRITGDELKFLPLPEETVFEHIHAILVDREFNLWVTNADNEIIKQSFVNKNKTEKFRLSQIDKNSDITALYQDSYNNIWIGTVGKGLYILEYSTGKYRAFNDNNLIADATILSITGKNNTVFVSTLQGSVFIDLSPLNKNIDNKYAFSPFEKAGIASNYIYNIFQDTKGRIWFATDGRGISVIEKGAFINYSSENLIKDDRIYSITEDLSGNIWFSTASAGLYKFDGSRFINFATKEGLSDLNISSIKTDKQGNIVIIHKKGLDILNPVTGRISYINKNKGINHLNVEDLGAVGQDEAGNIYMSSPEGIVVYKPQSLILQQPKTILESVQLFLNDLNDNSARTFSHDDNSFTFNFTGLYYTDPEQVYYQYKLEGFDTSWIATKDRSKTFPKLAPGTYKFRIQSALNRSFTKADEASFEFEIRQAFYKQWWFIGMTALLLGLAIYAYIRNRESGLKKMQKLQQEKIQFRFEVLRNQVNPHFLFNSFNTLISTIEEDPRMAVEYVEQLSDFFRNIVNYRDKDIIPLKEEMELLKTYYFLQKKRYGDNLQLNIVASPESQQTNSVPPLTLQLLLENAIKHNAITKETPLFISIDTDKQDYLNVSNNINPRLSKEAGAGMGLQNIINRYHLLTNKQVKVSETEKYFTVSLPLLKMNNA